MSNEVKSVKSKIAKLMALGQSNPSVEEANVALSRASTLMKEWGLTVDDIELGQEDITYKVIDTGRKQTPASTYMLVNLSKFLGVKMWRTRPARYDKTSTLKYNVLGYEADVEMFEFFFHVLESTIETEWANYKLTEEYKNANRYSHGKSIRASFLIGFCDGVNTTLEAHIADGETFKTKSGTALVPLKMAKIDEHFQEEFGIRLVSSSGYRKARTSVGRGAGSKAGGKVRFNKPVNGGNGMKMIGG